MLALVVAFASMAAAAAGPPAPNAPTLLTQYKCYIGHADRQTKAGPAYVDVATHYRSKPDAVSTLAREIRRGLHRGGPWHMPPHPEVPASEARTMARYIMALRP
jgi:cytochrome c551/c552